MIAISNTLHDQIQNNIRSKDIIQNAHTVVKETASWLYSVNAFYKKIDDNYSDAFPDLAKPLQSSISQLVYSVHSLSDLIKELIIKIEQGPSLSQIATDLMIYPNSIPNKDEKIEHLNRFVSTKFMTVLNKNILPEKEDLFNAELEFTE